MRCWFDERGAPASAAAATLVLLLVGGCGTAGADRAPGVVPMVPNVTRMTVAPGGNGGVNTGAGPIPIGAGATQPVRLVSGSGIAVSSGAGPTVTGSGAGTVFQGLQLQRQHSVANNAAAVPAALRRPGGSAAATAPRGFEAGTD